MNRSERLVYIVDDEARMRKALGRLLGAEGFEVRSFASAREFLDAPHLEAEACLVLDVAMPELDGLALQKHLLEAGAPMPIVFLTGHGDIPKSVQAIKAGAIDFLTKPVSDTDLLRAIRAALAVAATQSAEKHRYESLTPRERDVMALVVEGKLNKQIAADLGTGEQNIKIHRGRVMDKMAAGSLAELVRMAERLSIRRLADV